jgi:hypothetical protein
MYLCIQVYEAALATIRSCGMVIACGPKRPPGSSRRPIVAKNVGQYSAPTASIISTLTTASYLPSDRR